jgi:hypothetical protein
MEDFARKFLAHAERERGSSADGEAPHPPIASAPQGGGSREGGLSMTAFNVVRFRVKPGQEEAFIEHHRKAKFDAAGAVKASVIRTGDRTFCIIGEWRSMDDLVKARPAMIGMLDGMRGLLEDLGGGLGVTDPVSGEVVVEVKK